MTQYTSSLIPFPDSNIPDIQIAGAVDRNQHVLTVRFMITGRTNLIFFPVATAHPQRRDNLWKTTCFEFFLAVPKKPEYWEFNMSPSGDWNAYHMDAYRQIGLRKETSIERLQFSVENRAGSVLVNATVDLTPLIEEHQQIEAQITSVIEDRNGHESYWALAHPGPQADFHRREGFVLLLNSVS